MKSHLDELLALRPSEDKSTVPLIAAAIQAIEAMGKAYAERAVAVRAERKASLLKLSGDRLQVMDQEAGALEIAVEQAKEISTELQIRLEDQKQADEAKVLIDRRNALLKKQVDFAKRIEPFYADFVEKFHGFAGEARFMEAEAKVLNRDLETFAKVHDLKVDNDGSALAKVDKSPVCVAYFERTCLPSANLTVANARHTPMAHHGKFWTGDLEGPSPSLRAELAERAQEEADWRAKNQTRVLPKQKFFVTR